ncbi:unnamed protein product [Malus baccata var. baccata]
MEAYLKGEFCSGQIMTKLSNSCRMEGLRHAPSYKPCKHDKNLRDGLTFLSSVLIRDEFHNAEILVRVRLLCVPGGLVRV